VEGLDVRWRTLVVVVALVVLAGACHAREVRAPAVRAPDARTPLFACDDFLNRGEAQSRLRLYLNPPQSVIIDYASGQNPSPEERQEAERAYLERFVTDRPKVVKALDPDGDGIACNRGPAKLPPGPVAECSDYHGQGQDQAQSALQRFLDPPDSVEHMTKDQAREYLATYAADRPRVIKSLDPDGDGKAATRRRPRCPRGRSGHRFPSVVVGPTPALLRRPGH
jgi:hypothetical protein